MFDKLKNWLKSLGKQDPNEIIPVTFDISGKKQTSTMTAQQADDLTESLFGERWYKTDKKPDGKTTTQ